MWKTTLRKISRLGSAVGLATLLSFGLAHASQIYIQQAGTSAAGGEPNEIANPGSFVIGSSGGTALMSPLLVIVGVYNGAVTQPTITYSSGCTTGCPLASVGTYGLTAYQSTFTSKSGGTAFDVLGLLAGGSEQFAKWVTADQAIGLAAPTQFSLYAFALDASLGKTPLTVGATNVPVGSFILGYSCQVMTDGTQCPNGDYGETVFTNTGLITTTTEAPEPGALALFAAGLLGCALFANRRRRVMVRW